MIAQNISHLYHAVVAQLHRLHGPRGKVLASFTFFRPMANHHWLVSLMGLASGSGSFPRFPLDVCCHSLDTAMRLLFI